MNLPEFHTQHILLGYSSEDDHLLFRNAVNDLPYLVHLSVAAGSQDVMTMLESISPLPALIILDLELSDRNGVECLKEIKGREKFAALPVIVYAKTAYPAIINELYESGAHLYIRKNEDVAGFKKLIHELLSFNWNDKIIRPPLDEFVLTT
ncbi:MAG TPA: response regulator [Chryseolinea sp.]